MPAVVSQAPQHFRPSETVPACNVRLVISIDSIIIIIITFFDSIIYVVVVIIVNIVVVIFVVVIITIIIISFDSRMSGTVGLRLKESFSVDRRRGNCHCQAPICFRQRHAVELKQKRRRSL